MNAAPSVKSRLAVPERSETQAVWWVPLVFGGCWLAFALLVFRLDATSVHGISILFGVVCLAGAAVELAQVGTASGGWRVVRALLGIAFFVIGILAFLHPGDSFSALATIFAFYLLLRGLFDIGAALLLRDVDLWWVGLVTGVVQVALAFWAAGDFGHKAVLLVVWVGASALLAGIRQIVFAFQLRGERS